MTALMIPKPTASPENPVKEEAHTSASEAPIGNARPPAAQHVMILGAGPAGVGAAYQLVRKGIARVTVLEQRDGVGGNAGSFELDGVYCDYGSHRLHPAAKAEIMQDLRRLLGKDLLLQTRHGRILLQGRWIHFPLKPMDLLLRLPKTFALGVLADMARKLLPRDESGPATFATVLERGLGRTICREFYFPYARKLWGVNPEELAVTTAQKRVSGNSFGKMLRKIAGQMPGLKTPGAGRFYYLRRGYGQISQCLYEAARDAGAEFKFGARVTAIEREGRRIKAVRYQLGGEEFEVPTRIVWSTIPISLLVRGMRPEPPQDVLEAASRISFRGMILIYLVLDRIDSAVLTPTTSQRRRSPSLAFRSRRISAPHPNRAAGPFSARNFPRTPGVRSGRWATKSWAIVSANGWRRLASLNLLGSRESSRAACVRRIPSTAGATRSVFPGWMDGSAKSKAC